MLHTKNGKILSMNGIVFNQLELNTTISISASSALDYAKAAVNANVYKWEIPIEEEYIKLESGNPDATFFPTAELVYVSENPAAPLTLAYKLDIYAHQPVSRAYIYVDAGDGTIVFENKRIHIADAVGTAVTAYSGNQTITADYTGSTYRLREAGRGNGIRTYDMNEGTNYGNAVDFTDGNNFWNNVNANQDEVATDAHWGAEVTYDYFMNEHNRNSIDGNAMALLSYVHYNNGYSNAFWDGQRMTYGDGSGSYNPFTALDITGHEITHGLTDFTANLVYSYESGALNESFSDIFGTTIEYYGKPSQANWFMGEDIGVTLRSMSNPKAYGDPDTYQGTNWQTGSGDNGGVHTNSGVQNFWYYLLTNGGNGTNDNGDAYNINGIGLTDAGAVAFRNLTVYLSSNSQYADARFYAIQSAIDLFGACSPELVATTDAWYAVGVGPIFDSSVTADFAATPAMSCSAPFTVPFTNLSSNGGTFDWDFGDGGTDTATAPTYTYNNYGTYTVGLVADGNPCGLDSITKVAYITVDSLIACVVNLPLSGSASTQIQCTGTVFDNGGAAGDYADNTTNQITISPTGASFVTLTVVSFDIEPGSGGSPPCDYDYVEFFDGPTTASPSLGRYCNTTGSPGTVTSTGGSITIFHYADPAVNGDGFEIQWACTLPNSPPSTDFSVNDTATCTGQVQFTDLTTNGPSSWNWDFGDGGSSTQQHPGYTYANNGTYTVKLVTTNGFGSDSLTITSYIYVSKPTAPGTTSASRCGPGTLNLSAGGAGTLNWYDDSVGTNLLNTGGTFTTPSLSTSTTYYVEDVIIPASQNVGPPDNSFGGGGNHTSTAYYLIFDCFSDFELVSVLVYAQGAGFRTIELRNSSGNVLQDTTVDLADGTSRIFLNFDVTPGTDYQLATSGMSSMYRNNTNTNFPYTLAGVLSITGNNIPDPDYYYYYYDWEVRDPTCTSEPAVVMATINPVPSATTSSTAVNCNGSCDGLASVSVSSGTAPYTYSWSNAATTSGITELCQGNFGITVTDANGCTDNSSAAISEPGAINLSTSSVDANCGNSDGQAAVAATSGITPYTYAWNDPGLQTTATATGLSAGSYNIIVTDANGCTASSFVAVSNTVPIVGIPFSVDVTCNGGNNGGATASANSGSPPYTYIWSDLNSQTNATATGLTAGTYTVTATDATGCLSSSNVTINEPAAMILSVTNNAASCSGICDGDATGSLTNGTSPFTYSWDDPDTQTAATAVGLCSGSFNITVIDADGCTTNANTTVSDGAGITVNVTSLTNTSCGVCNGDATVNTTGGTGPYTYAWNDPGTQSTAMAAGLCAGLFDVVVVDADGCSNTNTVEIFDNGGVFSSISAFSDVSCNGASDGQATVTATGGGLPYIYLWNDPASQTVATAVGLASGTYSATITDSAGCITTATVTIMEPAQLSNSSSSTNATCGNSDGTATINVSGGTGPYTYLWDDGNAQTTAMAINLTSGNYNVNITDANGCTDAGSAVVNNTTGPVVSLSAGNVLCNGDNDGQASASVSGGQLPYTYLWDDPGTQTTAAAMGLTAGTYSLTVTDGSGCQVFDNIAVAEPGAFSTSLTIVDATCGSADGQASVSVGGATPPYSYVWNDPGAQTTASATGLMANTYQVIITDANGCAANDTAMIADASGPIVNIVPNNVICFGGSNGMAATSVSGGTAPYTYLWDDANTQNAAIATGLSAGSYTLVVTDGTGCVTTETTTLGEPAELVATTNSTDAPPGGCTGTADVSASGGTPPYTYLWSSGQTTTSLTFLCPGIYTATVTDANGCVTNSTTTVDAIIGVVENNLNTAMLVYPNPSTGKVFVEVKGVLSGAIEITVTSITGQLVFSELFDVNNGHTIIELQLSGNARGFYTVMIKHNTQFTVEKLVLF